MDQRLKILSDHIVSLEWDHDASREALNSGRSKPWFERLIRKAINPELDYSTGEGGPLCVRYTQGRHTVIVSFLDPYHPVVIRVKVGPRPVQTMGSKKAKSKRGGSKAPRSYDELVQRVQALGYEVTKDNHPKITWEGKTVMVIPGSSSDWRSIKNCWSQFKAADKNVRGKA